MVLDVPGRYPERGFSVIGPFDESGLLAYYAEVWNHS
jgi:hypothetical protein